MTLTQAEEIYYRYAKQVLDLEQEMLHGIAGLSASSHIRIGVNSIWGNLLVSSITPMFYKKYPGSSIQVIEGNHIQLKKKIQEGALRQNGLSCAFRPPDLSGTDSVFRAGILYFK